MSTPIASRGMRLRAARPRPKTAPDALLLDALPELAPDDPLRAARAAPR